MSNGVFYQQLQKEKRDILYRSKILCSVAVPMKTQALQQWLTDPGRQCRLPATFCTAAPSICGHSLWNLLHVSLWALRILMWLLDFWKKCTRA